MSVISNAKEIADLIKKIGDVELYRKIVELEGEIIDLTRANRELEDSVQSLTRSLDVKESMSFRQPFYYQENDNVPFCPNCWETNKVAVHMVVGRNYHAGLKHTCPNCETDLYV